MWQIHDYMKQTTNSEKKNISIYFVRVELYIFFKTLI